MTKTFKDVFPTLKLDDEMWHLLDNTDVTKISANHDHNHIRIYLRAKRLIFKKNLWILEKEIQSQIFRDKNVDVSIIESFELSEQYTPETLFDIYFDSILKELENYSVLEYNLLRTATIEFDKINHMILTVDNTIIAKTRTDEIVEFLEKIVCERCGMDLIIQVEYREPKESKYRKNSVKQIEQEVQNIISRTKFAFDDETKTEEENAPEEANTKEQEPVAKKTVEAKPAKKENAPEVKSEKKGEFRKKYDSNPDVIYGRDFDDETIEIEKIDGPIGEVAIRGKILSLDTREIRNEKTIVIFSITDFTDTIVVKLFARNDDLDDILDGISPGKFIKLKGVPNIDKFDGDLTIGSIAGVKKIPDFTSIRMDNSVEKRVELHCHTKMSDMDGVSDVKDIVKRAMKWGHKAIAITDHGDVQAFPEANHAVDDKFKVIYGVEAYLVDDTKDIVFNSHDQSIECDCVVFDLETTGFSPEKNKIIEIGAVKVSEGKIVDKFSTFVNPQVPIPFRIEELTSIRDDMVIDAPLIEQVLPEFMEFCKDCVMVAHNADFDMSFIKRNCELLGIECNPTIIDTVALARVLLPQLNRFKLDTVAKALNISLDHHHRAVDDAGCTAEIFVKFIQMLHDRGLDTFGQLNEWAKSSVDNIRKANTYHAIILATCDQGRTNLYRLISLAHIKYYNRRPRIPKSNYLKHKEGLMIGSACEAGELYQAIIKNKSDEETIKNGKI